MNTEELKKDWIEKFKATYPNETKEIFLAGQKSVKSLSHEAIWHEGWEEGFKTGEKKGFHAGQLSSTERCLKIIKEFEKQFCYPNKPINTFQYARDLKEGIEVLNEDLSNHIKEGHKVFIQKLTKKVKDGK